MHLWCCLKKIKTMKTFCFLNFIDCFFTIKIIFAACCYCVKTLFSFPVLLRGPECSQLLLTRENLRMQPQSFLSGNSSILQTCSPNSGTCTLWHFSS